MKRKDHPIDQVIYALQRQERALDDQADRLMRKHDYSAELPAADANAMRVAIKIVKRAKLWARIRSWFQQNTTRRFDHGYDYGAGVLLRSNGTEDPTEHIVDFLDDEPDAFDEGIRQAVRDYDKAQHLIAVQSVVQLAEQPGITGPAAFSYADTVPINPPSEPVDIFLPIDGDLGDWENLLGEPVPAPHQLRGQP